MKNSKSLGSSFFAFLSMIALFISSAASPSAKAEGYIGGLVGFGIPMGTDIDFDNGSVFGATVGYQLLPALGVAATYHHTNLGYPLIDENRGVDQYLVEANFFSLVGLNGGIHVGQVKESTGNLSDQNLGFGPHVGMDFKLTNEFSVGASAYWTYVTADDKHGILDITVPVKFWF